jgi:hypothetical protein
VVEADVPCEKIISNEDVFNLLVRIHRLAQKVRAFVSMVRSIASLQRYVQERIDPTNGGFILDVKVNFNYELFLNYI